MYKNLRFMTAYDLSICGLDVFVVWICLWFGFAYVLDMDYLVVRLLEFITCGLLCGDLLRLHA